jgi:hypothetical protein
MIEPGEITLTLPRTRDFHNVAHLVVAGLALRLNLTIETLEDLQLALGAILDHLAADDAQTGGEVTIALSLLDGALETRIQPVDLMKELSLDNGDLNLRRVLWTVADDVQVDHDSIRLTKKVNG